MAAGRGGALFYTRGEIVPPEVSRNIVSLLDLMQVSGDADVISLSLQLPSPVMTSVCLEKLGYEIHCIVE